jgi:hypothetical protein
MIWLGQNNKGKYEDQLEWRRWFAWRPVVVGLIGSGGLSGRKVWAWACYVERRETEKWSSGAIEWEYRRLLK